MNIIDIILALGLFWMARKGWQIGLIQSLMGLISVVLAYGLALTYGESAARALLDATEDLDGSAAFLGFVAVFVVVLLGCYLIGRALHKALQASPLGIIDAFGGGGLGLIKGLLIFGLITTFARLYPLHSRVPELIDQSALGPPVQKAAQVIADGVQAVFPKAKTLLEKLGIQVQQTPPLVDKLNKEADEARKKINELLDESRQRLESR
jgi:membrane protein required for colicin V production